MNRWVFNLLSIVFINLSATTCLFSQELYGLKFNANDKLIESRTSLELLCEGETILRHKFELSFDLTFYDDLTLGYICRFIHKNDEISLYFFPFTFDEYCYFDLVLNNEKRVIRLSIPREKLQQEFWHKVKLKFSLDKDSITLMVDDNIQTAPIDFGRGYSPKIIFGFYGRNPDLPTMCIRDVKLNDWRDKAIFYYPLNEYEGNNALDRINNQKSSVKNPVWLAKDHFFWKEHKSFKSDVVADFCFNDSTDQLYVVGEDSLMVYDIMSDTFHSYHYKNKFPVALGHYHSIYDHRKNRIIVYVFDDFITDEYVVRLAELDLDSFEWKEKKRSKKYPKSLQHSAMIVKGFNYPVVFGGYGEFNYHDEFLTLDTISKSWKKVHFTGDSISPRYFSSISQNNNGKYFFYGGFGNEVGRQIMGAYHYYDLYVIDTREMVIKKVWELPEQQEGFVGASRMFFDEKSQSLYTLCYGHHLPHSSLKLYKFDANVPKFKIIGDTIPLISEKIYTEANLYYSRKSKKLITAIREDDGKDYSLFRFYSLRFPPIDRKDSAEELTTEASGIKWFWYVAGLMLLAVALFFVRLFRKRVKNVEIETDSTWNLEKLKEVIPKKNVMLFVGTFKVISNTGKDITHLFPPRLQRLLNLVLIAQLKDETGISSSEISRVMWPDKDTLQAKNIRSVTFSHLRTALEDIEGIDIVFENKHWKVVYTDKVFIDLIHFINIAKQFSGDNVEQFLNKELKEFLAYASRGQFCPSIQEEWMDNFKSEIEAKMVEMIVTVLQYCRTNKSNELGIIYANTLLNVAPFNEVAIQSKIKFLKNLGKLQSARNTFAKFVRNYEKNFGQSADLSLNEILEEKNE